MVQLIVAQDHSPCPAHLPESSLSSDHPLSAGSSSVLSTSLGLTISAGCTLSPGQAPSTDPTSSGHTPSDQNVGELRQKPRVLPCEGGQVLPPPKGLPWFSAFWNFSFGISSHTPTMASRLT